MIETEFVKGLQVVINTMRRLLDENALMYYTMGNNSGYTGNTSKYQI